MVSSPSEEDTRRARFQPRRTTSLPLFPYRGHISRPAPAVRDGTLGCPPRLPGPLPRVSPDVENNMPPSRAECKGRAVSYPVVGSTGPEEDPMRLVSLRPAAAAPPPLRPSLPPAAAPARPPPVSPAA